jgi:hypothetical protein
MSAGTISAGAAQAQRMKRTDLESFINPPPPVRRFGHSGASGDRRTIRNLRQQNQQPCFEQRTASAEEA